MDIDNMKGHPAMDYAEHGRTYKGFVSAFVWGTIACVVILVGMAWTLL
ncbi:MAG: aa3-type cytochrome c oxidase subunit IV [Rhizobiales bacterium]|nr:aa3-type cytochrome c oxidase subunit IV [Hyphomicrobiales bacterium]